jgi:hypothetical protein
MSDKHIIPQTQQEKVNVEEEEHEHMDVWHDWSQR